MSSSSIGNQFEELIRIVERLRGPDGCPWDKEQTSSSLISYLLEETYEVIEAIDEKNWDGLKEEIGDLMLHIVFQATIAKEDELFDISINFNVPYNNFVFYKQEESFMASVNVTMQIFDTQND